MPEIALRPRAASPALLLTMAATLLAGAGVRAAPPAPTTIAIDPAKRFQTIVGWEATAQAGQSEPEFGVFSGGLFDQAVGELGINRIRLGVGRPEEHPVDPSEPFDPAHQQPPCRKVVSINDNDDPRTIDWKGFDFRRLDFKVERVVLPIRKRLEARGEKLYLNLLFVGFPGKCEPADAVAGNLHTRPEEYAELVLAAFLHLREKYALVPDALEVILEPDNRTGWTGGHIGRAMVAASKRLAEKGIAPEFIAPSTTHVAIASKYLEELLAVPGARQLLREISYHRYGATPTAQLADLARRAASLGVRTSMLERIGADVDALYEDLHFGNVSAWQQYTLAFPAKDNGAQYYRIVDGRTTIGDRTRQLRQYFHYVRAGAVRIGAASDDAALRTLAFLDRAGRAVVVVHLPAPRELSFTGLPPGAYGASLTSEKELGRELGELMVGADGTLRFRAPSAGVLTLYPR